MWRLRPGSFLLLLLVALAACSPTSTTAALGSEPTLGDDGWYGVPLEEPRPMPELVLTDTSGAVYDLRAETVGHPTLLFFGYASCPDICPVHLSVLARAMEDAGVSTDEVKVVFVSTDPARDTPETVGRYLASFDDGFVGLTGDIERVERAIRALGLPAPTYGEPDVDGYYTVGHPAAILAFGADGMARRQYPFGTRRAHWVHDLPMIVQGGDA